MGRTSRIRVAPCAVCSVLTTNRWDAAMERLRADLHRRAVCPPCAQDLRARRSA